MRMNSISDITSDTKENSATSFWNSSFVRTGSFGPRTTPTTIGMASVSKTMTSPRVTEMEMENYNSNSEKKKVEMMEFYPLEGCESTQRITLLPTKLENMVRRKLLEILIPTKKKTKFQ